MHDQRGMCEGMVIIILLRLCPVSRFQSTLWCEGQDAPLVHIMILTMNSLSLIRIGQSLMLALKTFSC